MTAIINVADIVEFNGKTIRQNNLEKSHNIPLGTLVEVKYDDWFGDGAGEKVHARLWVVSHGRDCDGTPLYGLSKYKDPEEFFLSVFNIPYNDANIFHRSLMEKKGNFSESCLTVVNVTPDLERGIGRPKWNDEER